MSGGQPEPMILVIGIHNDFLHVYPSVAELLADCRLCAAAAEKYGALEFFDSEGFRLAGRYDGTWRLRSLTRTAEDADAAQVLQRMHKSLDNLRRYIKDHSDEFKPSTMTVDEALNLCQTLNGSPDLVSAMRDLAGHFSHLLPEVDVPVEHTATTAASVMCLSGPVKKGDPWGGWCHLTGWC